MTASASTMLDAARELLALGLRPIPARGKDPLVKWKQYQTEVPHADQIEVWWGERWPEANVGHVIGGNFLVVDLDGEGAEGLLHNANVVLPGNAPRVRTGSGGFHVYLAVDQPVGDRIGLLTVADGGKPQVDIRGVGFVVAPPSIHPDTRRPYEWIVPFRRPLPQAPAALIRLIHTPKIVAKPRLDTAPGRGGVRAAGPCRGSRGRHPAQCHGHTFIGFRLARRFGGRVRAAFDPGADGRGDAVNIFRIFTPRGERSMTFAEAETQLDQLTTVLETAQADVQARRDAIEKERLLRRSALAQSEIAGTPAPSRATLATMEAELGDAEDLVLGLEATVREFIAGEWAAAERKDRSAQVAAIRAEAAQRQARIHELEGEIAPRQRKINEHGSWIANNLAKVQPLEAQARTPGVPAELLKVKQAAPVTPRPGGWIREGGILNRVAQREPGWTKVS
jgi:hypothetical protein